MSGRRRHELVDRLPDRSDDEVRDLRLKGTARLLGRQLLEEHPENWEKFSVVSLAPGLKNGDINLITVVGTGDFFMNVNRAGLGLPPVPLTGFVPGVDVPRKQKCWYE